MKSYIQFIKENNYIQERLDATAYGEVKYGASASKPKSKSEISNMVSTCLLYTSPSPRDLSTSRMPSSA